MHLKNMKSIKKSKGSLLLDISIGMVVLGVLVAGIYAVKTAVDGSVDTKKEGETYLALIGTVEEGWGLASSYVNADIEWLIGTGKVLPEWVVSPTEIRNGYNGLITLTATGPGNRQFIFTAEDIPSEECEDIVRILSRESATMGTNASNTNIKASPGAEFDPNAAQAACTASDPVDINVVTG